MQVTAERRELAADPGTTSQIVVSIINTGSIIDGLSARIIGVGDLPVRSEPPMLPLFPEGEGRIALSLDLPLTHPAGVHPLTVEVLSQTTGTIRHADVELEVAAQPAVTLSRTPRMVRARRSGRFVLAIANTGNVALDVELTCSRRDAGATVNFSPATLRVEAGTTVSVMAVVKGPRMITGAELDRSVDVELAATVVDAPAPAQPDEAESPVALTQTTKLQLRQRPMLSRGLITFLILAAIVALWAAAFLLGLGHVFSADPMTKTAPASYFAALAAAEGEGAGSGGAGAGAEDGEMPPGVMPKSGLLPPGVGGEISGVVTAVSDGSPVGRILVEAYRITHNSRQLVSAGAPVKGEPDLVSSGATQSDGSYELAGLFPTSYRLKFSAEGYEPVWYPDAGSISGGDEVSAIAQGVTEGVDVVMVGKDASISGKVDSGDELAPARTQVTARLLSSEGGEPVEARRTTTDAQGRYELTDLVAPGTYELSFVADGYAVTTVVQKVAGGEDRIQPHVLLSAGGGQISGTVRDGSGPLGGVTVSTTVGGEPVSVITPTTGAVGAYSLQDLPTPGTYVVTFTADGHGSRTEIIDLEPGESRANLDQRLAAGTGSVTGVVRGPDGAGLGGVEVTVGGVATVDGTSPSTTTITSSGDVGTFAINQLPVPGEYTLTFSAPGFGTEIHPVSLSDELPAATLRLTLATRLGGITGAVTKPNGDSVVGATVTATNGTDTYTATSSARGGELPGGGYLISDLPPGWYSVTVTLDGFAQRTALVQVKPGDTVPRDLRLAAS